ncbi:hypothetical protein ES708_12663 [subsurface metagenome]
MRTKNYLLMVLIMIIGWSCINRQSGIPVVFPEVNEPVQVTKNGKEHLFASYYGINSWSKSERYVTVLETGKAKLIVSISQIKNMVPEIPKEGIEYFNHTLFSRGGSKIFWLARAIPNRNTTAFTVNRDGSNIQRCFPDNWGGSHFDWLNDDELMITASYVGKHSAHILFTVGEQNYKRLGNGLLDYDGHGTFSPDGKWMVTDTYPTKGMREQKIYLMDMETQAVLPLGRFIEPKEFSGFWRCDIHCRWSPRGDMIGFNSTYSGSRQVYVFKLIH